MTKQDIIERAKRVSFSSKPKDYIEFVGELAKENEPVPSDILETSRNYADKRLLENKRELAESGHTRHFKMGYVCFAGYEIEGAFADGMQAERERLMKDSLCGSVTFCGVSAWVNLDSKELTEFLRSHFKDGDEVRVIMEGIKEKKPLDSYENRLGDTIHNTDD